MSGEMGGEQLSQLLSAARELSRHEDPHALLDIAADRSRLLIGHESSVAITRRNLEHPRVRLLRSPLVKPPADPWKQMDQMPIVEGGLFAELLYAGEARVITNLNVPTGDPAAAHLVGMTTLAAVPHFESGEAIDMTLYLHRDPHAFNHDRFMQIVALSSFFGQTVWDAVRARGLTEARQSIREQYEIIAQLSNTVMEQALNLKDHSAILEQRVRERTADLREANLDTIYMLALAAEAKDQDTGDHLRRIQKNTSAIARQLGMSETEAADMGHAAILHDVGKLHIPDHILKKPGPLTEAEFAQMKEHTTVGERILGDNPFFASARKIARSHHENFDASGYPDSASGESIPIEARIVHLVDVFDALTSPRCYKSAWARERALDYIEDSSGQMFDPQVVRAFGAVISENK